MSPLHVTRTLPEDATDAALRADVQHGLTANPKWLPPKWFYDARGSELFEQITELPEYYPTRAEREILAARSGEIAAASGARTLIELGSGSSEKTRFLIDALAPGRTSRSTSARAPSRRPERCSSVSVRTSRSTR